MIIKDDDLSMFKIYDLLKQRYCFISLTILSRCHLICIKTQKYCAKRTKTNFYR